MANVVTALKALVIIISFLLLVVIYLQPSQKTGLIGDTTDAEVRVKRGFELVLFRTTIFLITCFFVISIAIAYIQK
ncbi:MAG: preprotein translocase subunit SecG [Mycoplasmatales bacterium]